MLENSPILTFDHLLRSQHMCIEHIRPRFASSQQQSIDLRSEMLRSDVHSMRVRILGSHSRFHCRPALCAHVCGCVLCPQVSTIFVLGFPADVKERELQNLLRWLPGYEASQLSMKGDQLMGFVLFQTSTMAMSARDALQVCLSLYNLYSLATSHILTGPLGLGPHRESETTEAITTSRDLQRRLSTSNPPKKVLLRQ